MTSLLVLSAAAFATSTSPGVLWPGASPIEANHGSAGAYVAPVPDADLGAIGARVVYAPTDRFALQFDGALLGSVDAANPGLAIGGRYLLVQKDHFRLAGTAEVGGLAVDDGVLSVAMAGLALEAGSRTVWFDASVPLVAVTSGYGETIGWGVYPIVASELGLDIRIATRHTLRLGSASFLPVISYAYEADRWFARGDVSGIPDMETPAFKLTAGARF